MARNPKVSILVPIYKVPEPYLKRCIESCISQTLKEIEIILVDDGSPDHCGAICDGFAQNDGRIKVIHKSNGGLAAARNSAFDRAEGEYITFLDGDDFLEENACELAYTTAKAHNVQMVFWNQYTEYTNSTQVVKTFGDEEIEFRGERCKKLQARVLDFNGKIAQAFSKLIDREFLVKYNVRHNDELRQGAEGFIFNIALFEHLESAYYLPVPLLHYVHNEQSISHSPDEKNYYFVVRCFEYIEEYVKNSENRAELQRKLYNRMLYVIVTTGITGYFNPANRSSYKEKVEGFQKFLEEPLLVKSLKYADYTGVSAQRKFILRCIQWKQFWVVAILGKMRRMQLARR